MKTCTTCRWSFASTDESYKPILICWPKGESSSEQLAFEACEHYEREAGADDE